MQWELKGNVEGQQVRAEFRTPRGQTVAAHVDKSHDDLHIIRLTPMEVGAYKGSLTVGEKTVQSLELEASESVPKVQFNTRASDMHAHVDVKYTLPFTLAGISLNNLRVTVSTPSGVSVPVDLQRGDSNDKAQLVFTPTVDGPHRIVISLDGQQVSQPLSVAVHAYSELRWGEYPNLVTVGATATYNFELHRIHGETIEGHLIPSSGAVTRVRAVPSGRAGFYSVSFAPQKSDTYSVQLVVDTHRIPPELELKVVEHAANFSSGNSREGRVGVPFTLRVSLNSSAGHKASVKAPVYDANNTLVGQGEVTPTSDGVSVSWTPKRSGRYNLKLEVDGVTLPSGDVSLTVPSSRQVTVVRNSQLILGEAITFTVKIDSEVTTSTVSGKALVSSKANTVVVPVNASRNSDDTWDVKFVVPAEANSLSIELVADGHTVDNRINLEIL